MWPRSTLWFCGGCTINYVSIRSAGGVRARSLLAILCAATVLRLRCVCVCVCVCVCAAVAYGLMTSPLRKAIFRSRVAMCICILPAIKHPRMSTATQWNCANITPAQQYQHFRTVSGKRNIGAVAFASLGIARCSLHHRARMEIIHHHNIPRSSVCNKL